MNQILVTNFENDSDKENQNKDKKKKLFKIQMITSILLAFILYGKSQLEDYNKQKVQKLTESIDKNLKVSSLYNVKKEETEERIYFGKIIIPKIDLEYTIFNNFNEELLKIAPCKFYGVDIGEKGNICIAGHNYNDRRFFGKLFDIEVNDIIKLVNLEGKSYIYKVYDMYETEPDDLSCLKNEKKYELTLVTCNNSNKKRRIIKAVYNEFIDK